MIPIGFRGAIALVAAALSLVTLGAAFATVSLSVNRSQESQFDEALLDVADAEAVDLALHPEEGITISDRPGPSANDVGPLPLFGALYGGGGRILNATPTFGGAPPGPELLVHPDRELFDFEWKKEPLRGAIVTLPGGNARLLVAASRLDLDGDAAFLKRAMMVVFGVAVGWTMLLAFGIAGRITRTHRAIVSAARRVSGGDLSARVGSVGRSGEMAGLARDIDEMIERLAVLLRGQEQFIAHAAHELRSPLTTLYGELSHALRRPRTAEEYRAAIEQALGSTRRLKQLTEDLLALARLGASVPEPVETVSIEELVGEALEHVRAEVAARGISVTVASDGGTPIRGRRGDLERLFRNLLENAARHSPDGGTIEVRCVRRGEDLAVEVSDEGGGVPAQDRDAIFSPFFRRAAKGKGNPAGAGLGLTIARDIARLHGGDLTLVDTAGRPGATFAVRFPAETQPPAAGAAASE